MIYIFIATLVAIIVFSVIYAKNINYNELKYDEKMSAIIETLGENTQIAEEILKMLGNTHTKVKNNPEEKAKISFYNHVKDEIVLQNFEKSEVTDINRIQLLQFILSRRSKEIKILLTYTTLFN